MAYFPTIIDASKTGATLMGSPLGNFYPRAVIICAESISGIVVYPTLSIGVVSPNYVDIFPATLINVTTSKDKYYLYSMLNSANTRVLDRSNIYVNVSIAITGTACKLSVGLDGSYM